MFPSHIVYPALRLILVNRLQKIANSYEKTLYSVEPSSLPEARSEPIQSNQSVLVAIPLNRIQKENQICYVSAFALRLAKLWQQPALDIANYIAGTLNQEKLFPNFRADPLFSDVWQNCSIYVAPPGWIYLELDKDSVAAWLQIVINLSPYSSVSGVDTTVHTPHATVNLPRLDRLEHRDSIRMFEGLHSYARCTSLLRLAEQAGFIRLNSCSDRAEVGWRIVNPFPLPWLQEDGNLRCKRSTEQHLITQLIDVMDELGPALSMQGDCSASQSSHFRKTQLNKAQLTRMTQSLSQAFQAFYSDCRIFNEIQTTDRPLAQVRCGLVLITRTLLRYLIQSGWGIEPPSEL